MATCSFLEEDMLDLAIATKSFSIEMLHFLISVASFPLSFPHSLTTVLT